MEPQPFTLEPTRQHPGWIAVSAIRQFRGLVIPLLIVVISRSGREDGGGLMVFALLTLAALLWQVVAWWFLTYEVRDGQLLVHSGVISRRERLVPLERIQAVDLSDTPLQRMLGLTGVRIETAAAGAKETEIRLEAVTQPEAEALRTGLLAGRGAAAPVEELPDPVIFRLSLADAFKAGATSGRIAPAMALLLFSAQLLDRVLPEELWLRLLDRVPGVGLEGALLVGALGAMLAWGLSIGGALLTWSNFEVRRDGDRLAISHGLLDRRRSSVPLARIQAVTIREGMLRRPFGLADVTFSSAGWGKEGGDAGTLAPVMPVAAAPALIAAAVPGFALPSETPAPAVPPQRALRPYLFAAIRPLFGLITAALIAAAVLPQIAWWWGLLALAALPLAALDGWYGRRDSAAALTDGRVLLRQGGLTRALTVTVPARLQRRGSRQTLFMRRAGLATLVVSLARGGRGGPREVRFLLAPEVDALVAKLAVVPGPGSRAGYTSSGSIAPIPAPSQAEGQIT
jgi:putative membrane protein